VGKVATLTLVPEQLRDSSYRPFGSLVIPEAPGQRAELQKIKVIFMLPRNPRPLDCSQAKELISHGATI
jgi:hypothetical protein